MGSDMDYYMAPWNDDDLNADGGIGGIGGELGPGDLANLIVKLTDNALSGAMFERRVAARGVLEAFKQSCFAEEDTMSVIAVIEQLINDPEQVVRQEIMEHLPEVALFCHEEGPYLDFVVPQHIIPHIVKLLTDDFRQVRKAAQDGILALLEKAIIAPRQVAEQVCPVIMQYTEHNVFDDYRTELTGFMGKLARFVGKEMVVNWFLERYCTLCQDPLFQVRRVCASSMGEIAAVVGTRLTEAVLLPEFLALCTDDVWGVRKGCAEIFTEIARLCQISTRTDKLTPAFVKLLDDSTRWVKVAAYQSLGSFITTFACEADSPVEVPELTEFEKTFIERVKESPTLFGGGGATRGHHRSSMLGSESTEDLTAICIQDEEEEEGKVFDRQGEEEKTSRRERMLEEEDQNSEKNSADNESLYALIKNFKTWRDRRRCKAEENDIDHENDNEFDVGDSPEDLNPPSKNSIKYRKLYKAEENEVDHDNEFDPTDSPDDLKPPPEKEDVEVGVSTGEENKCPNNSQTTNVSVHTSSSQPGGVHIHVEKEAPEELGPICRSSSVLSHRPASIGGGGISNSHVSSSNATTPAPISNSSSGLSEPSTPHFNTFQYWRIPLPDIELDIGMVGGKPASVHVRAKVEDPNSKLTYASEISVNLSSDACPSVSATITDNKDQSGETNPAVKVENLQIQTLSSSSIVDNESEQTTKIESSLSNTTVSLVDGRLAEVHRSYMDLYNVTSTSTQIGAGAAAGNGSGDGAGNGNQAEGFTFDFTQLDTFDDDSDDQLSSSTYPFRDEPKKTRLLPEIPKPTNIVKQDVVPDILLDHFIGMSQDTDPELAPCCVFNLPAVVITLGPSHWSVLRDCYENLASSLQWKVRYTLAACLHEIANILGPELSERDLIPFYNALLKDLDEVRIGVLKHLSCFFKILGGEERKKCLQSIKGFIKTDNPRNWRFRLELVYQIRDLVDMFELDDIFKHICPVCIDLIKDNVAEIRKESLHAVTYVVKRLNVCHGEMSGAGDPNVVHEFLVELVKSLSESSKWVRRQTFAALSGQLIGTDALYPSQFAQDILPHLIGLSDDKVPNVRLVVARSIVSCVLQLECFNDPLNPHSIPVMETLQKLQEDVDQDVRYHSKQEKDLEQEVEEENLILAEKK